MNYSELVNKLESLLNEIELTQSLDSTVDPYSDSITQLGEIYFEITEADLEDISK